MTELDTYLANHADELTGQIKQNVNDLKAPYVNFVMLMGRVASEKELRVDRNRKQYYIFELETDSEYATQRHEVAVFSEGLCRYMNRVEWSDLLLIEGSLNTYANKVNVVAHRINKIKE